MADEVINYNAPVSPSGPAGILHIKQISWPAVFSGVLVALAVGIVFLSFGLFIGFKLTPGGAITWSTIWDWVTSFFALWAGGAVAGRLAGNPNTGKLHGIVTWGLATVTTFAVIVLLSWGVVTQAVGVIRTATVATAAAAPAPGSLTANQADRLQNEAQSLANQAQQQAPYVAQNVAHDISRTALVLWIGFMIAAAAGAIGGAMGAPKREAAPPTMA